MTSRSIVTRSKVIKVEAHWRELSVYTEEIRGNDRYRFVLESSGSKGHGFVQYTQFRYHDGTKWSSWEDTPLIFSGKLIQSLNKLTERPNSPMYIGLEKNKNGRMIFIKKSARNLKIAGDLCFSE